MKKALALASVVLMAASLTACGGDENTSSSSGGSYCDQVKAMKAKSDTLDFTQLSDSQYAELQSSLRDIEAVAPDDVKADWATFNDGLDQIAQLLNDAGLSFDDVKAMQGGSIPEGTDLAKLQEFADKVQQLTADSEMTDASKAISQNIKDECGVDLDTSSTTGG
jgi:ABC-type glycerol-3-phosphate transport system substrate-binding protein